MSREQQRIARRWARERIVEAIRGLLMSDWPFDDPEFSDFSDDEKKPGINAIKDILSSIEIKTGNEDELAK